MAKRNEPGTEERPRPTALILSLIMSAGLFAAACGNGSTSTTAGGDITFGAIVTESGTGTSATSGEVASATLTAAASRVNSSGGVVVNGKSYTLKWVILDDRNDPQVAAADAVQLFRDNKVSALFGPGGVNSIGAVPVAARNKVLEFTAATSALSLLGPKYPLLWADASAISSRTGGSVTAIQHFFPSAQKVAIMTGNDPTIGTILPGFTTQAQAAGFKVDSFLYPSGTTDLSTVATKVVADRPDVIYTGYVDTANVMRQLDAAGLPKSVPIFAYNAGTTAAGTSPGRVFVSLNTSTPVDLEGADASLPKVQQFVAEIQKAAPSGVTFKVTDLEVTPETYGWDAIPLLVKAMEKAGTITDAQAIANALPEVSNDGLGGTVQFSADHTLLLPMTVIEIQNGQRVSFHTSG